MSFLSTHLVVDVNCYIQPLNNDRLGTDYYTLMNPSIIIKKKKQHLTVLNTPRVQNIVSKCQGTRSLGPTNVHTHTHAHPTQEYHSTTKKNETLPFETMWMDLEDYNK